MLSLNNESAKAETHERKDFYVEVLFHPWIHLLFVQMVDEIS